MAESKMDLEIFPKLTITEETAETCLLLLGKYLDANPDKTIKVTTEPGGDGFVRKVEIVPEWGETKKEKAEVELKEGDGNGWQNVIPGRSPAGNDRRCKKQRPDSERRDYGRERHLTH